MRTSRRGRIFNRLLDSVPSRSLLFSFFLLSRSFQTGRRTRRQAVDGLPLLLIRFLWLCPFVYREIVSILKTALSQSFPSLGSAEEQQHQWKLRVSQIVATSGGHPGGHNEMKGEKEAALK